MDGERPLRAAAGAFRTCAVRSLPSHGWRKSARGGKPGSPGGSRLIPKFATSTVADEALQWLWAFDEASLWFCCHGPTGGETRPTAAGVYAAGRGTPIEMKLSGDGAAVADEPERGVAHAVPWRFDVESFDFEADAPCWFQRDATTRRSNCWPREGRIRYAGGWPRRLRRREPLIPVQR